MDKNTFTLNGKEAAFTPGQTILEAARDAGVTIPSLCHLKGATPTGACRVCLVEVSRARSLMASCSTPVAPGMVVLTDSERVRKTRKLVVELLLSSGHHDCIVCEANGNCRLHDLAYACGITEMKFPAPRTCYPTENVNPLIVRDFSRCVLCGRCVQACNEVVVNRAITLGYRGSKSKVVTGGDGPYTDSECVFCGQCVEVCPVGALTEKTAKKMGRPWETQDPNNLSLLRRQLSAAAPREGRQNR